MTKVLITGGCGYLGSVLSEHLLLNGYDVTVYDNLLYNQTNIFHLFKYDNFKFVKGDVRDESSLHSYLNDSDVIIPLAAIVGMPACKSNPQMAIDVNFKQIQNIIRYTSKDKKIILPNTNSQYGSSTEIITEESPFKPLSLYAETKCDAEKLLLDANRGVSLRLATVFGISPRMRLDLLVNDFVWKAVTDGYLVLFEHNFKRNYIHVQDIARTFQFMIENYEECVGDAFNVGLSTANLSKMELAKKIKEYIHGLVIKTDEFKKDIDKRNYIVSNEKLESRNWTPKYDLDYGINQLIGAYQIILNERNKGYTNL